MTTTAKGHAIIANGLSQIADIVDQLSGKWSGPGHPKIQRDEIR